MKYSPSTIASLTAVTSAPRKQEQITLYELAGVGETHCGNLMENVYRLMGSARTSCAKEGIAYVKKKAALGFKVVKRRIVMFIIHISMY